MISMTPQARAIAAFSLAVLLIPGYLNRLVLAAFFAVGADVPGGKTAHFVLSLLTVVLAAAVLWLAHTAAEAGGATWETSLAQAARLIAVIGVVIAVLATIAVLTNDGQFFGTLSLSF
jgi:hypothetical protein